MPEKHFLKRQGNEDIMFLQKMGRRGTVMRISRVTWILRVFWVFVFFFMMVYSLSQITQKLDLKSFRGYS